MVIFHKGLFIAVMNKKYQQKLLDIINEEIEYFLLEQDPSAPPAPTPPADPSASGGSPPADPNAPPDNDKKDDKDDKDDIKKKIESLSKKYDEDIRKTILAKLQNGGERKEAEDILRYVEKNKNETDPEKLVPKNVIKTIEKLQKDFDIKTPPPEPESPEKPEEKPEEKPPATAPSPVTESRLQKLVREYLTYKKLYLRSQ